MMAFETISTEDVREIFRGIVNARGTNQAQGDFLTTFAEALLRADDENFLVLLPAAAHLICKYRLTPPRDLGDDCS